MTINEDMLTHDVIIINAKQEHLSDHISIKKD